MTNFLDDFVTLRPQERTDVDEMYAKNLDKQKTQKAAYGGSVLFILSSCFVSPLFVRHFVCLLSSTFKLESTLATHANCTYFDLHLLVLRNIFHESLVLFNFISDFSQSLMAGHGHVARQYPGRTELCKNTR